MINFIIRRMLIAIPTLLVISFIIFAILDLAPDPTGNLPITVPPEVRAKIRSDRKGYLPVVSCGMLLAAFSLGLLPLANTPSFLLLLALSFGLAQALIFPATLALFAQQMDVRHTGAGAGLIGAFKNFGKIAGPILGKWLIFWQDYSWMLWSMAALLAVWSCGLLLRAFNKKSLIHKSEYGEAISVHT